tara:strand:- start:134 stop:631 length:498 start_codon:yes stop_codon:yes gene_type:complete
MRNTTTIENGKQIYFSEGRFDAYCVFTDGTPFVDKNLFSFFKSLNNDDKVYTDFVGIYNLTNKDFDENIPYMIKEEISSSYPDNVKLDVEESFVLIYYGMVAEENKDRAPLGKRIKRLGMHQVLKEDINSVVAANFSKNKGAFRLKEHQSRDELTLNAECLSRGF